jgi:hypothetical protein
MLVGLPQASPLIYPTFRSSPMPYPFVIATFRSATLYSSVMATSLHTISGPLARWFIGLCIICIFNILVVQSLFKYFPRIKKKIDLKVWA